MTASQVKLAYKIGYRCGMEKTAQGFFGQGAQGQPDMNPGRNSLLISGGIGALGGAMIGHPQHRIRNAIGGAALGILAAHPELVARLARGAAGFVRNAAGRVNEFIHT